MDCEALVLRFDPPDLTKIRGIMEPGEVYLADDTTSVASIWWEAPGFSMFGGPVLVNWAEGIEADIKHCIEVQISLCTHTPIERIGEAPW